MTTVSRQFDRTRELARILYDTVELPGVSVTVAVHGQQVWSEAFGFRAVRRAE